jgi:hypothetical protein
LGKPSTRLVCELSPVTGTGLARISWSFPAGHGCDLPGQLVRLVEGAIRARLHALRLSWNGERDISVQVDPIWTEPDNSGALLDGHGANDDLIAASFLQEDSHRSLCAARLITILGPEVFARALRMLGYSVEKEPGTE